MKTFKTILLTSLLIIIAILINYFVFKPQDALSSKMMFEPLVGGVTRQYKIINECPVYDNPNGKRIGKFEINSTITIIGEHTDKNDIQWGCFSVTNDEYEQLWIKMTDCDVIYDNTSFMEEHKADIVDANNELVDYTTDKPIYLWSYPHSENARIMKQYPPEWTTYISKIYTDENNQKWGYIGYIWNNRGWIYISDPTANITGFETNTSAVPYQNTEPIYERTDMNSVIFTIIGIAIIGSIFVTIAIYKTIKTHSKSTSQQFTKS